MTNAVYRDVAIRHPDSIMHPYDELMRSKDGYDAIMHIITTFGGARVYVPRIRTVLQQCIALSAAEEYNGHNLLALAQKYGYSIRQMQRLLKTGG